VTEAPVTGDQQQRSMARARRNASESRRQLKKKLRASGMSEELIERIIERKRFEQLARRHGSVEAAAQIRYAEQPEQPNDSAYRPRHIDSTLRGAGRASGDTAKSIRRGRALASWEMNQ
jgi:SOS response regulatory protein OraA/RecX